MAKLSGFSPIITAASPQHTDYLKSLGATHVIDRHIDLSSFPNEVAKITSAPIELVYDAVSQPDTQKAAYSPLAPGGKLVLVHPSTLGNEHEDGKQVINTAGILFIPAITKIGSDMYKIVPSYFQEGLLKVQFASYW